MSFEIKITRRGFRAAFIKKNVRLIFTLNRSMVSDSWKDVFSNESMATKPLRRKFIEVESVSKLESWNVEI